MAKIEIIQPTERERGEGIKLLSVRDFKQWSKKPLDKKLEYWVQCNCPHGGVCPNNSAKLLCGAFQLCHIKVITEAS